MGELGGDTDLAEEPLGAEPRGEVRAQHLERDPAIVPEILRQLHGGHAAPAELTLEPVALGQGGLDTRLSR